MKVVGIIGDYLSVYAYLELGFEFRLCVDLH